MSRRILMAILGIAVAAVLLFGVPLAIVVTRLVGEDAALRVEDQAVLAARQVPGDYRTSGDPVELPRGTDGVSLSLYGTDGKLVIGDGPTTQEPATRAAQHNQIVSVELAGRRVVAVPVTADEIVIGTIRGAQPLAAAKSRSTRIIAMLVAIAGALLVAATLVAVLVARRLGRPIGRLRDAAVRLGDGDFTVALPRSRIPEVDEAADALAATAVRLERVLSRERAFAADASHQLRTPLAGLRAAIETELVFPRPDPSVLLVEALDDIGRLERTITDLLTLARTSRPEDATSSMANVQRNLRDSWHGRYAAQGRRLVVDLDVDTSLCGHLSIICQVLDVLLDNALVHGGGATTVTSALAAETITISVTDEGSGWPITSERPAQDAGDGGSDGPHGHGMPLAQRLIGQLPGRLVVARPSHHPRIDVIVGRADRTTRNPAARELVPAAERD